VTTVKRAVVQQRATGSLARKPIPGCPRRMGLEQEAILRARLEAAPDATVLEHGAWWAEHQGQQLSEATLWPAGRAAGGAAEKKGGGGGGAGRGEGARPAGGGAAAARAPGGGFLADESGPHPARPRRDGGAPHAQGAPGAAPRPPRQKHDAGGCASPRRP